MMMFLCAVIGMAVVLVTIALIIPHILEQLKLTRKENQQIMANLTNFATAFSTFATDFGKFKTDLATFLGTLPKAEDPAVQQQIDGFAQTLNEMDSSVQTLDASLKPAAQEPA